MNSFKLLTLALSLHKGIGPATFLRLLEQAQSIDELYKNLKSFISISAEELISKYEVRKLVKNINMLDIKFVCLWEKKYPFLLSQISDPPIVLFYKGNFDLLALPSVTIVGTRKLTSYGKQVATNFVTDIVNMNIVTVSGMAFGIDAVVHNQTLKMGGKTIAVLGSSVDNPTPRQNISIYNNILDAGGLIVSEYPPGSDVIPGFFARRNRILAGLSEKTIVIEAGIDSGALITAQVAFDYDREVFAVPGSIFMERSKGSNSLIRENKATLITSALEVFKTSPFKSIHFLQTENLSQQDQNVYNALVKGPLKVEEIAINLKLDLNEVIVLCSKLELEGIIQKNCTNGLYFI